MYHVLCMYVTFQSQLLWFCQLEKISEVEGLGFSGLGGKELVHSLRNIGWKEQEELLGDVDACGILEVSWKNSVKLGAAEVEQPKAQAGDFAFGNNEHRVENGN